MNELKNAAKNVRKMHHCRQVYGLSSHKSTAAVLNSTRLSQSQHSAEISLPLKGHMTYLPQTLEGSTRSNKFLDEAFVLLIKIVQYTWFVTRKRKKRGGTMIERVSTL